LINININIIEECGDMIMLMSRNSNILQSAGHIDSGITAVIGSVVFILFMAPLFCAIVCIPVFILGTIRRLGSWDETLSDYLYGRITTSTQPEIVWSVKGINKWWRGERSPVVTSLYYPLSFIKKSSSILQFLKLKAVSLRHSALYDDDRVIADVVAWISTGQTITPAVTAYPSVQEGSVRTWRM
jgi:hypothetical protein